MTVRGSIALAAAAILLVACNGLPVDGRFEAGPGLKVSDAHQNFTLLNEIQISAVVTNVSDHKFTSIDVDCQVFGHDGVIFSAPHDIEFTLLPGQSVHVKAFDFMVSGHTARWNCRATGTEP